MMDEYMVLEHDCSKGPHSPATLRPMTSVEVDALLAQKAAGEASAAREEAKRGRRAEAVKALSSIHPELPELLGLVTKI